ncbi:RIO1 family protein [Bifidobacterium thermophilum RBL67]|uniref:non-specific serine/threonine protein kinase n=2 Tax=Bifidobacterium thermophilum TaxID=33905 RepID=M4RHQ1_9BIFI|nr:RIO1 family protein [Bifidobacterium thermophilum RBL67]
MSDLNALNLEAGEEIGGYTLISRLGSGAMGSVWRVKDDGGQEYAMKILRDSLVDDGETTGQATRDHATARERLRREAMALRRIKHPGVCSIVDMELDDAVAFIVTELIEGRNLREDVAANGRYVGDDLERLSRKLIDAVEAVHAAGIVHRDIKPTNVMVAASGPILVDFGIAMGEGESHVTRTGLVMGTPGFIAPEIIDGAESSEATDWWSTASVLAFAATGQPVFGTKPMMAVLEREAHGNANLSGLPARTAAAFRSALDPDPDHRCTPKQLLHTIAADALNPAAWDDAQDQMVDRQTVVFPPADGSERPEDGGAMLPFDGGDAVNAGHTTRDATMQADNPRSLWVADTGDGWDDDSHEENGPESADIGGDRGTDADDDATDVVNTVDPDDAADARADMNSAKFADTASSSNASDRAMVIDDQPTVAAPVPITATAVMPHDDPTRLLPDAAGAPYAANTANTANTANETMPPSILPEDGAETGQAAGQPVLPATQAAVPGTQHQPNPADIKRAQYLKRGTLPLAALTVPVAITAAAMPLIAWILAGVLIWLLIAIGLNTGSQLDRESKRGGTRKRGDGALRVATMPWHIVKGLALTIPRALLAGIIATLVVIIATLALHLPTFPAPWHANGWVVPFVLLAGHPLSVSGCVLAGAAAIGWLVSVFAPGAAAIRLGSGALRGLPRDTGSTLPAEGNSETGQNDAPERKGAGGRRTTLLVIWLMLVVAAVVAMLMTGAINWVPLMVTGYMHM